MASTTGCTCTGPGYCERHKVHKGEIAFRLCQTEQRYFDFWENKLDPVKLEEMRYKHRRRITDRHGVGTYLTSWFSSMGVKAHVGCKCKSLAAEMDRVGVEYVEQHFEDYVEKMSASAKDWRKGKSLFPQPPKFVIRYVLRWAIKCSKAKASLELKIPEQE